MAPPIPMVSRQDYRTQETPAGPVWILEHTYTDPKLRGRGIARELCKAAFDKAANTPDVAGVIPECTYIRDRYMATAPAEHVALAAAADAACNKATDDNAGSMVTLVEHDGAVVPLLHNVDAAALRSRGAELLDQPLPDGGYIVYVKRYDEVSQAARDGGAGFHAGYDIAGFFANCAPELVPFIDAKACAPFIPFLTDATLSAMGLVRTG